MGAKASKPKTTLKTVKTRFSSKYLTSAAGLVPIHRFWIQLGAESRINEQLGDLKGMNSAYSVGTVLTIIIMSFLSGARHISDIRFLRIDSALRSLWDLIRFPVETTVIRTLKLFGQSSVIKLADINQHLQQKVWNRSWLGKVTIDIDSTVQPVYGNQEGTAKGYNPGHKGQKSYHPQLAFLAETTEVLLGWLRPGDSHTANGSVEFLKEALSRLPKQVWRVVVRTDAGYFSNTFLTFLEQRVHGYVVKCKMKNYRGFCEENAKWRKDGEGRWTSSFTAKPASWVKSRIFVAVRLLEGYEEADLFGARPIYSYMLWVTNLRLSPNKLESFYNQRANCENLIAQGKGQLGWSTMRTQSFWTNDTLFQLGILSYNLSVWFKRRFLPKGDQMQELATFRNWFIRAAGKVVYYRSSMVY